MRPSDPAVPLGEAADDQCLPLKQRSGKAATSIQEYLFQSSDPGYRSVPAHVSRKRGNTGRAEPPPSPGQRQTTSALGSLRPNEKKKGPTRFGDPNSSDSDSDSDSERKLKHNEDDTTVPRRHKPKPALSVPPEAASPDREAIEREERERTQLLRTLRRVADNWDNMQPPRSYNRKVGLDKRRRLLDRYDEMRLERHSALLKSLEGITGDRRKEILREFEDAQESGMWRQRIGEIQEQETNCKRFLDEVLRGDIEEKLREENQSGEGAREPSSYLEDVLLRVEKGVIFRCEAFDPFSRRWGDKPPSMEVHMVKIITTLYGCLWRHLSQPGGEAANVGTATAEFVEKNCPNSARFEGVYALEKAYMAKLIDGLADAVLRDRAAGRANPDEEGLGPVQIIRRSRQDGHLTPAYIDWICSAAEATAVEECCVQWQKDKRDDMIMTYRRTMESMGIQQEFCPSIIRPGVVSLVLFKGNFPATIRDVSADELKKIGWFHQQVSSTHSMYWRYEILSGNEAWSQGYANEIAFKVGMDGRVLGMWMMNGEWLDGDELEHRTLMNE